SEGSSPKRSARTSAMEYSPPTSSPCTWASMRSSRSASARRVYSGERSAAWRCPQRNWSSSKCSSRMPGMTRSFGPAMASPAWIARSIDGHAAPLDAVHLLGVGDQVLALDEDLAVAAQRDGAVATFECQILFGLDDQLVRGFRSFRRCRGKLAAAYSSENDAAVFRIRTPQEHSLARGQPEGWACRRLQEVTQHDLVLLIVTRTTNAAIGVGRK